MKKILITLAAMMLISVACVSQSAFSSSMPLAAAGSGAGTSAGDSYISSREDQMLSHSHAVHLLNVSASAFSRTVPGALPPRTRSADYQNGSATELVLQLLTEDEIFETVGGMLDDLFALKDFMEGYPNWNDAALGAVPVV